MIWLTLMVSLNASTFLCSVKSSSTLVVALTLKAVRAPLDYIDYKTTFNFLALKGWFFRKGIHCRWIIVEGSGGWGWSTVSGDIYTVAFGSYLATPPLHNSAPWAYITIQLKKPICSIMKINEKITTLISYVVLNMAK